MKRERDTCIGKKLHMSTLRQRKVPPNCNEPDVETGPMITLMNCATIICIPVLSKGIISLVCRRKSVGDKTESCGT